MRMLIKPSRNLYLPLLLLSSLTTAIGTSACTSEDNPGGSTGTTGGSSSSTAGRGGTSTSTNSGGATANGGTTAASAGGSTSIAPVPPVGTFSVKLTPANQETGTAAFASFLGIVRGAAMPDPKSWSVSAEQNGCQLLIPSSPLCDPKCAAGETCITGGKCIAAPASKSVGTVKVTGVKTATGASEFSIEPTASNSYVPDGDLAFPPFDEGATVELSATGGDYAAFSLSTKGIAVLSGTPATVNVAPNQAASVTWTAASASAKSTIELNLDISQHGGTKGVIVCNVADSGSLQIPATLISQLISLGVAGFPMISISRRAVASTSIAPGRVDLLLTSSVEIPVSIPGLTSCNDSVPCPTGKTCQSDYTCK